MSELEILTPIVKELTLQDVKITIRPFKFTQFAIVSKFIQRVKSKLGNVEIAVVTDAEGNEHIDLDFVKIFAECGEEVAALCSLASQKDAEFIDTLDGDEGLLLLITIFEVNKDFFIQKIIPQVQKAIQRLAVTKVVGD